mmetsp:Transcript_8877/g.26920  ORF Transcript_8877/g.26920 Transcript_8877/m.26920 type:complete len:318 (-) Transcript_8877:260-1213(-)
MRCPAKLSVNCAKAPSSPGPMPSDRERTFRSRSPLRWKARRKYASASALSRPPLCNACASRRANRVGSDTSAHEVPFGTPSGIAATCARSARRKISRRAQLCSLSPRMPVFWWPGTAHNSAQAAAKTLVRMSPGSPARCTTGCREGGAAMGFPDSLLSKPARKSVMRSVQPCSFRRRSLSSTSCSLDRESDASSCHHVDNNLLLHELLRQRPVPIFASRELPAKPPSSRLKKASVRASPKVRSTSSSASRPEKSTSAASQSRWKTQSTSAGNDFITSSTARTLPPRHRSSGLRNSPGVSMYRWPRRLAHSAFTTEEY